MSLLSRIEKARRRLKGEPAYGVERHIPTLQLGSDYGGYAVCPVGLNAHSVVYSFGIGEDISFDVALMERYGMSIHAFDPTPRSIRWVEEQNVGDRFVVHPWGLAAHDGTARFTPPENPEHISHTVLDRDKYAGDIIEVPVFRLETVMRKLGHDHLDILKMDIEGAEYDVVDELVASSIRPTQILMEYHHHLEGVPLARTEASVEKLQGAGYRIFALSDTGRELSFVRD